jgi:hypothetical protein
MGELPRFVLGVDPGKRTGISLYDLLLEDHFGQEESYEHVGYVLERLIERHRPDVAIEQFVMNINTVKNTQAPWSLKVMGIAEYLAAKYECRCVIQAQSSAKRFSTDARLRALGWYLPGKGHANDGSRQTLLHMVIHGWWSPILDEFDTIDAREG